MWPTIALMGANAILGAGANRAKQDQQRRYNMAQAETSRYSPWTHMQGQLDNSYAPGATAGAIGGAVQGLGMAQALGAAGMFGDSAKPSVASPSPKSMIGAPDYSAQLGQQADLFQNNINKPSMWGSLRSPSGYLADNK